MDFDKLSSGYYEVGSKKFVSKFEALKYATESQQQVIYRFFDNVWISFDKTVLGKRNLNDLYKLRALQLREEYDYLILYFSGGADSYNILRTFIDNNIKLDEVCVKWPMAVINKKLYQPNDTDLSASNYLSEWDYAIKPVLDQLQKTHPEIKITIVDWTENFTPDVYSEDLIKKIGAWNDVEMPMMLAYSPSELRFLDKGKKVASIYGVDKPYIFCDNDNWYMYFVDQAVHMGIPQFDELNNVEYFYWTPKMPEIAFEQAYAVCQYLEIEENLHHFYRPRPFFESRNVQNEVLKKVIYNTWHGGFQVGKPESHDREDKQFWIFHHPELSKHRDSFIDLNSLALNQLDPQFYWIEEKGIQYENKIRGAFSWNRTRWYFVKKRLI